jgi:ribosomal protein L31
MSTTNKILLVIAVLGVLNLISSMDSSTRKEAVIQSAIQETALIEEAIPAPKPVMEQPLIPQIMPQKPTREVVVNSNCHPSYSGCLKADASDYDCAGGSGNGPYYTRKVQVVGPDVFGLDRDGDGWGCE